MGSKHPPPVGLWKTCQGTFDCVIKELIFFRADGSGWLESKKTFGPPARETFNWKFMGIGVLFISEDADANLPIEDGECEVKYKVGTIETDVGVSPVICNESGRGFWVFDSPIEFVSATNNFHCY